MQAKMEPTKLFSMQIPIVTIYVLRNNTKTAKIILIARSIGNICNNNRYERKYLLSTNVIDYFENS